ncbi:hypothetical protein [Hymenobacter coalescens]
MHKTAGMIIVGVVLTTAAKARTAPTSLRQLVEEMQQRLKPTVGQKPPVHIAGAAAYNMAGHSMPLFLNGHFATLDSLNSYTVEDLEELRVDRSEKSTALLVTYGSWGTIYVRLKNKKQRP